MVFIRPTILRTAEDSRARRPSSATAICACSRAVQRPGEEPSIDQLVRDYMGADAADPAGADPRQHRGPARSPVPTMSSADDHGRSGRR